MMVHQCQKNIYEITSFKFEFKNDENGNIKNTLTHAGKSQLCTEEDNNSYFNYTNGMLCPPRDFNQSIYGSFGNVQTGFSFVFYSIYKCRNGTFYDDYGGFHNNTDCASNETIESVVNDVSLHMEFLDNSIDHDKIQPFTPVRKTLSYSLSQSLYRVANIYIQNIDYKSDLGYVFEEIETINQFKFHFSDTTINLRTYDSGRFSGMLVLMSDEKITFTRVYKKLQQTLANIGGLTNLIKLIAENIIIFFSEKFYSLFLLNKLFSIDQNLNSDNSSFQKIHKTENINEISNVINKKTNRENNVNNYIIDNSINQKVSHTINPVVNQNQNQNQNLTNYSRKLKEKLTMHEQSKRIISIYTIRDLILSLFMSKRYERLNTADMEIKKILSTNSMLKMHFKIENLIDIIFSDDDKDDFLKIKRLRIDSLKPS